MLSFLPFSLKLYLSLLTFGLGAFFGSALNCLAYRMVHQLKWSRGRSFCPHCGHTLSPRDLIPLLSYGLCRGKCRYCGLKIPSRYLVTELILGSCFVSILWRFDLTFQAVSAAVLCGCLLCLSLVDLDIMIIPNRFLLIPALLRIVQLLLEDRLLSGLLPGAGFGLGLFLFSLAADALLQCETLGGGDIKLMALLGLYFSVAECFFLLILACLLGILSAITRKIKPGTPFPFGPYLSIAAWLTLLFGSQATAWYLSSFQEVLSWHPI